jgi:SERRATE/Ars2, N-terminal domain
MLHEQAIKKKFLVFYCYQTSDNDPQTQPPMLTFKQFMNSQDDSISDVDAVKKFGDYKTDFHKQQIHEFFVQHKQEEW